MWGRGNKGVVSTKDHVARVGKGKEKKRTRRKRGYWPTMYMMLEAMTALLSLPRFISQRPSRSLMTVTRNLFSSSSSGERQRIGAELAAKKAQEASSVQVREDVL